MKIETGIRPSWDNFRSEICHELRRSGDKDFIIMIRTEKWIETLWDKGWYAESLYILAITDILCNKLNIPIDKNYEYYRKQKLKNTLFPSSIEMRSLLFWEDDIKGEIINECKNSRIGSEFLKYNIIEGDIYDVI